MSKYILGRLLLWPSPIAKLRIVCAVRACVMILMVMAHRISSFLRHCPSEQWWMERREGKTNGLKGLQMQKLI